VHVMVTLSPSNVEFSEWRVCEFLKLIVVFTGLSMVNFNSDSVSNLIFIFEIFYNIITLILLYFYFYVYIYI